jgi:hypothetical protein
MAAELPEGLLRLPEKTVTTLTSSDKTGCAAPSLTAHHLHFVK